MPGDPKECRLHARHCIELAEQSRTPEERQRFLHLSETSINLATELESAQAFLRAMDGVDGTAPDGKAWLLPGEPDAPSG